MPAGPEAPRAPGTTSVLVGSGSQRGEAAAIRSRVSMAVPDGASALASWWSSMTSAVSKYGAASSAKRIISTAPMAKLGATRQLLAVKASRSSSRSMLVNPVVPTTACTWLVEHHRRFSRAAASTVKSTATSTPASAIACAVAATSTPSTVSPACWGSTAATSSTASSSATASHTVAPMRPPAPNTPTRIVMLATLRPDARSAREEGLQVGGGAVADVAGRREGDLDGGAVVAHVDLHVEGGRLPAHGEGRVDEDAPGQAVGVEPDVEGHRVQAELLGRVDLGRAGAAVRRDLAQVDVPLVVGRVGAIDGLVAHDGHVVGRSLEPDQVVTRLHAGAGARELGRVELDPVGRARLRGVDRLVVADDVEIAAAELF